MKKFTVAAILLGLLISLPLISFADEAPVIAATPSSDQTPAIDTSNMSIDQRVALLERQMAALNQVNMLQQMGNLQSQVQDLQGQVEVLTHNLQTMQTQATSQYADLDQRLRKLEGNNAPPVSATANLNNPDQTTTGASMPGSSSNISADQTGSTSATTGATDTTGTSMAEQQAYQAAYDKLKGKDYPGATTAMQGFITQYPSSQYSSNAYYWLGQLYLLQGDGKSAEKAFNTLIAKYPSSPKVPDANLKLGFAYLLENKQSRAKEQFKEIMQEYPGTPTAQLAQARLAQMP